MVVPGGATVSYERGTPEVRLPSGQAKCPSPLRGEHLETQEGLLDLGAHCRGAQVYLVVYVP